MNTVVQGVLDCSKGAMSITIEPVKNPLQILVLGSQGPGQLLTADELGVCPKTEKQIVKINSSEKILLRARCCTVLIKHDKLF